MKKMIDFVTIKFLIVGVVNTLVGTSVMFVFYNVFGFGYWVASASNYVVGSVVSFFLNKYFTFKSSKKSFREILYFVLNITICYVVAYGLTKPCVFYILKGTTDKVRDNVAMFIGMGLFVILNYLGQRFVVFKK